MIRYSLILVFSVVMFFSCESKEDTSSTDSAEVSDTSAITTDSSNVDTTTMYEKQHYGNGNTETSGNSGH